MSDSNKIVTTKMQFNKFKKYCEDYKKKFGLENWTIYYEHKVIKEGYANNSGGDLWVATIRFAKEWPYEDKLYDDKFIRETARHEILHLITSRLYHQAFKRCTTESSIVDADELAVKYMETILDRNGIK